MNILLACSLLWSVMLIVVSYLAALCSADHFAQYCSVGAWTSTIRPETYVITERETDSRAIPVHCV
jgi:hypothetical protein